MIKFIVGLTIGIVGTLSIWLIMSPSNTPMVETRKCMTQTAHLLRVVPAGSPSLYISIGDVVICAKDWQISNVYGPDAETFYGRIKLRDWDSNEFTSE